MEGELTTIVKWEKKDSHSENLEFSHQWRQIERSHWTKETKEEIYDLQNPGRHCTGEVNSAHTFVWMSKIIQMDSDQGLPSGNCSSHPRLWGLGPLHVLWPGIGLMARQLELSLLVRRCFTFLLLPDTLPLLGLGNHLLALNHNPFTI